MAEDIFDETTKTNTDVVSDDVEKTAEPVKSDETVVVDDVKPGTDDKPVDYSLARSEESKLSEDDVKGIEAFAKDKGLNKEAAESLLKSQGDLVDSYAQSQADQFKTTQENWSQELKDDKDFGGEKLEQTAKNAQLAAERFMSEDFREMLEKSGFGNHPGYIKAWAKVGAAMADDTFVHGKSNNTTPLSMAETFYGKNETT